MNRSGAFYCVKCNKLEQSGQASTLFRTGFYRVIHPLGCCVSCETREAAMISIFEQMPVGMMAETSYYADSYRGGHSTAGNVPDPVPAFSR